MKIAIIGGASVRTPLLVRGLSGSDLPIDEIALFDLDRDRLRVIAALAQSYAPSVRACDDPESCVADAAFVVLSIRAGGVAARARDEATAVAHGVVGQETVGPAGFAMAMRTVPPAVEYARLVARSAPRAWLINFTNPVGIVTQAMRQPNSRVIGICDTPTELFERVAHVLRMPPTGCFFDYVGLNHLGWLREVYKEGEPQLNRLWDEPDRLADVYSAPLFPASFLRALRLLPTEYLFFYYSPVAALDNMRRAGSTRADAIAKLNAALFQSLSHPGGDRTGIYEAYLEARTAGYMRLESGQPETASGDRLLTATASPDRQRNALSGYDRIALDVIRAIYFSTNAVIPLNVPNVGAIPLIADDEIVEVPCVVNANGAHPLTTGTVPESVRGLLTDVKEYERLTIGAAMTRSVDDAVRALAANPLVASAGLAASLVDQLQLW